jgi:hypothetical protein
MFITILARASTPATKAAPSVTKSAAKPNSTAAAASSAAATTTIEGQTTSRRLSKLQLLQDQVLPAILELRYPQQPREHHFLHLSGSEEVVKRASVLVSECISKFPASSSVAVAHDTESAVLTAECVFCYDSFPAFSAKPAYTVLSVCGHLSCPECLIEYTRSDFFYPHSDFFYHNLTFSTPGYLARTLYYHCVVLLVAATN